MSFYLRASEAIRCNQHFLGLKKSGTFCTVALEFQHISPASARLQTARLHLQHTCEAGISFTHLCEVARRHQSLLVHVVLEIWKAKPRLATSC